MGSVILCEGSTDYTLLQYYMRKAYEWKDDRKKQNHILKVNGNPSRKLFKDKKELTIAAVGGCNKLQEGLQAVIDRNGLAPIDSTEQFFERVVILTDHDEIGTESDFVDEINKVFVNNCVQMKDTLTGSKWIACEMTNNMGEKAEFQFLLLIIPFEDIGAMETFLLNAISANDVYDAGIISRCNNFVDNIDPEKKYLNHRRIITKAKFDTYFSIRTPAAQFNERQNILKSVKWEEYTLIQKEFKLLENL